MNITKLPKTRRKWYQPIVRYEYGDGEAAEYFQRLTYTKESLDTSVTNSIKIHEYEIRSAETLFGSIKGLFFAQADPDKIKIDGLRLLKLFEFSDINPPIKISISQSYLVEIASVKKMLSKIK
ncbi:MAG: hypothetical protein GY761_14950 [Hyphomicrobiales bacterium]|nr:hypothetical protein [Hyphomicrobiales bacterium]